MYASPSAVTRFGCGETGRSGSSSSASSPSRSLTKALLMIVTLDFFALRPPALLDRLYGNCAGRTRCVLPARLLEEPISQEKVHPNSVPVRVPSCCRSQSWEEWMPPLVALAMMLSLTAATTHAQAPAP